MLRALILRKLDAEERALGASLDYARHIARVSLRCFIKFALLLPVSKHRRRLPTVPYHVARLVATVDEDCGTCVQIEINLARKAGVPADTLRAVLARRPQELSADAADAYHFALAVVTASGAEAAPRERLRERLGEEALVELSLAIAAVRVFPIIKRGLGYATSCAAVRLEV